MVCDETKRNDVLLGDNIESIKNCLKNKNQTQKETNKRINNLFPVVIQEVIKRQFSLFHLFAFKGFTQQLLEYCIPHIKDVNIETPTGDTALMWAAWNGHSETVVELIKNNADVNKGNDRGITALHRAIQGGHIKVLEILLDNNADPNVQQYTRKLTPLCMAAEQANHDIVKILLAKNANPDMRIQFEETPLHCASRGGNSEIVQQLIVKKVDIDATDSAGNTSLLIAAKHKRSAVLNTLLLRGSQLYEPNHSEENACMYILLSENKEVWDVLINLVKSEQSELTRPLLMAARLRAIEAIAYFLKHIPNNEYRCDKDGTILHHAVDMTKHKILMRQLKGTFGVEDVVKRFAGIVNINETNDNGDTALHIACRHGLESIIEVLLEEHAKLNIKNKRKELPIHVVARSQNTNSMIAEVIMNNTEECCNWEELNGKDQDGNTVIDLAATYASADVLIKFENARLDTIDDTNSTPLHEAARRNDPDILETMLDIYESKQREGDINTKNDMQLTVLDLAAANGFSQLVTRLLRLSANIESKDENGNTVLHRLIKEMSTKTEEPYENKQMEVVKVIFQECLQWWCRKNDLKYPPGTDDTLKEYKRKAILYLVHEVENIPDNVIKKKGNNAVSVMGYAFQFGAIDFINYVMTMPDVMTFKEKDNTYYDVTYLTPTLRLNLNEQEKGTICCDPYKLLVYDGGKPRVGLSYIEILSRIEDKSKAVGILDITPIKHMETMYENICAWTYLVFLIMHVLYMSIYTYIGVEISATLRNNGELAPGDGNRLAAFLIVSIEPGILLFVIAAYLRRIYCQREVLGVSVINHLVLLVYILLSVSWLAMIVLQNRKQDYVLATTLCFGWMGALNFTTGFKGIHYFYNMIFNILIKDISKFLVVFVFVILAFGCSFHVVIQASDSLTEKYHTTWDTLFMSFNLMFWSAEVFDEEFEQSMIIAGRNTLFAKFLYILYVLVASVILLNLLIAMMNDSYIKILADQTVSWRMDAVMLGIGVESSIPFFARLKKTVDIRKRTFENNINPEEEKRWFLEVSKNFKPTVFRIGPSVEQLQVIWRQRILSPSVRPDI